MDDDVVLFHLPTQVRFDFEDGSSEGRDLAVVEKEQDFYFPRAAQPDVVRFDPDFGTLAKVAFDKPKAMLYAQLGNTRDVIGRLRAVEALKSKDDLDTIEHLRTALTGDPSHAVRTEASKAFREIHTRGALDALRDSAEQADARVRKQVVSDIGGFYRLGSREAGFAVLASEANPAIVAVALGSLGKYGGEDLRELLAGYLASESCRNDLAIAAVRTIRTVDDPAYLELLRGTLESRGTESTAGGLGTGLRALGYLARNEDDRAGVREFLSEYLAYLRRSVRIAPIDALGELRDPQAIGRVQTFAGDKIDAGVRRAAEKAVRAMREARRVPVELSDMRVELVELREQHDELAEEFAALEERVESVAGTDSGESDVGAASMDANDAPPEDGGADAPVDED